MHIGAFYLCWFADDEKTKVCTKNVVDDVERGTLEVCPWPVGFVDAVAWNINGCFACPMLVNGRLERKSVPVVFL